MALEGNLCSFHRQSSSIVWDLPNFGVLTPEMSLDVFSPFTSDLSSGYLEDALGGIEWSSSSSSSCFKRRRMLSYPFDPFITAEFSKLEQNFWSCDIDDNLGNPLENSGFLRHRSLNPDDLPKSELKKFDLSDESSLDGCPSEITKGSSSPSHNPSPAELKEHNLSSSSLQRTVTSPLSKDSRIKQSLFAKSAGERNNDNKKVVYPFDMVKPGGIEGDMTLKDINKRILMRPTRPVRHPVGDLAFRPSVSTNGYGPSGKAVATLTRIHTQGRGSVTIIRTRG